ncbi:aminopeptidase M1-D [Selaginella moellendorffii]|uniref:aminopeptidase M1-D n=1 Tax=Selaginella moellendorffii TaxID=88036 RepID=UPI000D1CFCEC|nr:aminopeptidase M1-D [Selaginella moellendorffii]|eukprot:XP_024531830.1 aminopeptidase M1-D [Selaginella moellendorffii]
MRLPRIVVPQTYNVELWVNLESCEFQGRVRVSLDVTAVTSVVQLNTADLTIDSVLASLLDSTVLPIKSVEEDKENELLIVGFDGDDALVVGSPLVLTIDYHGSLNKSLKGFYEGSYEVNGTKRYMAATDFEPGNARRCFPCWDEPDFKATFTFKVHAPSDRQVLSNMPVVHDTINCDGTKTVEFEETVRMSTYIIAIVVGEFDYLEGTSDDGVPVRVYTRRGYQEKGRFVLNIILKLLPFFAEFFQLPYPLPKLDAVAVPEFKTGALENFGCIVYREEALYADENSPAWLRQRVACDTAHEIAHMWFGNIVTLEWWTHLWLNEGMATWMSCYAVDYLFPEWEMWMDFQNWARSDAFRFDSLEGTHPVEVEVRNINVDTPMDSISYFKGASLLHMLQSYLGHEELKEGLRAYVKKFAFGNATSSDLWSVFEEVTGKPIKQLMHCWTKEEGFPVVKASLLENTTDVQLEQARFMANGRDVPGKWIVPVLICSGVEESRSCTSHLLVEERSTVKHEGFSGWIKVNAGETGFFRVQYDKDMLRLLREAVSSGSLEPVDRLGLLKDMHALCRAGKEDPSELFSLLESYRNEGHPLVISTLVEIVVDVTSGILSEKPEAFGDVKQRLASLLETPARRIGWEATECEGHLFAAVRGRILDALVRLDHDETCSEAERRFDTRFETAIPSDLTTAVLRNAVKDVSSTNRGSFDALISQFEGSTSIAERVEILSLLAGSNDPAMVREALEFALSPKVLAQHINLVFEGVNEQGCLTAWSWLKDNWNKVHEKACSNYVMKRILYSVTAHMCSREIAEEFRDFVSSRDGASDVTVACWERVCLRAQWTQSLLDLISTERLS